MTGPAFVSRWATFAPAAEELPTARLAAPVCPCAGCTPVHPLNPKGGESIPAVVAADAAEASARLADGGPGWAVVAFAALDGGRVLLVRDGDSPAIPPALADLPRFTVAELFALTAGGPVALCAQVPGCTTGGE